MTSVSSATPRPLAGGKRPLLALAAESIAAASGSRTVGTVVDVVHGRALHHYREGLRQYLATWLGDVGAARIAVAELRAIVAAHGAEELLRPPGVRARLYAHARRLARQRRNARASSAGVAPDALPWRRREPHLARLRTDLPEGQAELLELRHARELAPEEIAFVLEQPVEAVLEELERATRRALAILHRDPHGDSAPALRRAVLEAFALEPDRGHETMQLAGAADEWESLPTGTVIGGRYAIEARVGTGAFGDVYRAKDTEVPGHVVALKLLHQPARSGRARRTALRELHLIASVFHPSVVQFKDHGWHEGRLWFVMPWYEGETLESRMLRRPLSRAEARRIFEPLARALATMHAAGIRHQDVKPDNIFLARIRGFGGDDGDGNGDEVMPVLIDLGVAAKEAEMVVAGTPTYFAPEVAGQFAGVEDHPPVTTRADVFALALSLRNALEPETQPDVPAGAVESFIEDRARELPPMPAGRDLKFLRPSLARWMSLDPDERPTADELAEELAVLTRPEERRRRILGVLRWLVPLGIALAAVFVAVVYVLSARAERQELEAQRARMAEASLRQDLASSREERRTLERDMQETRERYARSRLSREQMATELARTESTLHRSLDRLDVLTRERDRLRATLQASRRDLEQTRAELSTATARGDQLDARLAEVTTALEQALRRAQDAEHRVTELDTELASSRARLDAERAKSARLEQQIEEVVRARLALEAELRTLRERIAELDAQSEAAAAEPDADATSGSVTGSASDSEPESESGPEPESESGPEPE